MKNKILFVTPILCHPFRGGPEMSVHNAIKAISSVSNLSLIYWGKILYLLKLLNIIPVLISYLAIVFISPGLSPE